MRKRKPWKFIFILLFAVAISLGVYVYQQQYEPDDLFVKVGEGILDNAPEIFSGEPKEVQELGSRRWQIPTHRDCARNTILVS
ncbi:MAG: hypothetical protein ACLU4P_08785 [Ruminococcus sp.]